MSASVRARLGQCVIRCMTEHRAFDVVWHRNADHVQQMVGLTSSRAILVAATHSLPRISLRHEYRIVLPPNERSATEAFRRRRNGGRLTVRRRWNRSFGYSPGGL